MKGQTSRWDVGPEFARFVRAWRSRAAEAGLPSSLRDFDRWFADPAGNQEYNDVAARADADAAG